MLWNVINPKNRSFYEKPDGTRAWELSESEALKISEGAIVVSMEEFGFNGSLRALYHGESTLLRWDAEHGLVGLHAEFDPHLGWLS